jgi:hypothetical protein
MGDGDSLPPRPPNSEIDQRLPKETRKHLNPNSIRIEMFEQIPEKWRNDSIALCVVNRFLSANGVS